MSSVCLCHRCIWSGCSPMPRLTYVLPTGSASRWEPSSWRPKSGTTRQCGTSTTARSSRTSPWRTCEFLQNYLKYTFLFLAQLSLTRCHHRCVFSRLSHLNLTAVYGLWSRKMCLFSLLWSLITHWTVGLLLLDQLFCVFFRCQGLLGESILLPQ